MPEPQTEQRTCLVVALERLEEKAIRDSTYRNYLQSIKALGLEDVPFDQVTVRFISRRLQAVLTESTRKKHATNVRACLGIKVPLPKIKQKEYDLPSVADVHEAFRESRYRIQAYSMLYGGLRLGEACINQPTTGNLLTVTRQRTQTNEILPPKSTGKVVLPSWFAQEYREAGEFSKSQQTIYVGVKRRTLKMLGREINPHQLRHLFATHLVDMGASPRVLQAQMRHSDVQIALRYYVHTRQQDIANFMERFGS